MSGLACPEREDCSREREINFKKRDIVNLISEEIACYDEGTDNPGDYTCWQNAGKPTEVMICYRVKKDAKTAGGGKEAKKEEDEIAVKPSKSRELRGGILYVGCDCEKRNGLQDDCRRTGCHGSPECLKKPAPICGPSEFSNGKHLGKKGTKGTKRSGGGGETEKGGQSGGGMMADYHCVPAVIKKVCCHKC